MGVSPWIVLIVVMALVLALGAFAAATGYFVALP
jgi:hypothetical protein